MQYRLPGATWVLEVSDEALAVMRQRTQRKIFSRESVGQLFTQDVGASVVRVGVATILKPVRAQRAQVQLDPQKAYEERETLFAQGLHFVGLWHTHPETVPEPSERDRVLALDHARAAQQHISGLIFVIAGTQPFPAGLGVWIHDGKQLLQLELEAWVK